MADYTARNAISAATMQRPASKVTSSVQKAIDKTRGFVWNGRIFVAPNDPTLQQMEAR